MIFVKIILVIIQFILLFKQYIEHRRGNYDNGWFYTYGVIAIMFIVLLLNNI